MRGLAALILIATCLVAPAYGQANCLREHFRSSSSSPTAGIEQTDAENLVDQVKTAQQFVRKIVVVECPFFFAKKAVAFQARGQVGIPDGEYIIYDSTWMQEMVGDDKGLAYIILAHEIGHFVNGDFADGGNDLLRPEQELAADRYAACAFARNGGNWASLENLLSRIRAKKVSEGALYKDKFTSIAAAKESFQKCGGDVSITSTSSAVAGASKSGDIFDGLKAYQDSLPPDPRAVKPLPGFFTLDSLTSGASVKYILITGADGKNGDLDGLLIRIEAFSPGQKPVCSVVAARFKSKYCSISNAPSPAQNYVEVSATEGYKVGEKSLRFKLHKPGADGHSVSGDLDRYYYGGSLSGPQWSLQ